MTRSFHDVADRIEVINLVVLLALRNPRVRENIRRFQVQSIKTIMGMMLSTKARWESQVAQARRAGYLNNTPEVSYEAAKKFFEDGQYDALVPTMRFIQLELNTFDKILPCLIARKWSLVRAQPDPSSPPTIRYV